MSWLVAKVYDSTLYLAERACLAAWRSELLGQLQGDVIELGAGTGLNLAHYSDQVRSVVLVEPDRAIRRQLERKLSLSALKSRARILDAFSESLTVEDASCDAVLGTLVLCSVRSVERTLAEAKRVLRPGGILALIEHVAAPTESSRRRWQSRVEPLWFAVSGGCHLVRDPRRAIRDAGFEPVHVSERQIRGVPGFIKPALLGLWALR